MNHSSLKTILVIALLLASGLTACRQTTLQQLRRYPHEHLQPSSFEPLAKLPAGEYKLAQGETLASVARLRYGHQKYASVIKLYNHIEDETKVPANSLLRLPDMSAIFAEEGLTKVIPEEVNLILCARAKYDRIKDQLWALPRGSQSIPENLTQELMEAADDLHTATERLKVLKPGMNAVPLRTIGQLEQSMEAMRSLTGGLDTYGYDIDIVQQHFGLALTYAIIWARDGFK